MRWRTVLDRVEARAVLDKRADLLLRGVNRVVRGPLRKLLQGVWIGHPLHPAAVHVPIGAWVTAAVLDTLRTDRRSSTVVVGAGLVTAVPAAAAGFTDWSSLAREQRRVGLVHAAANTVAVGLYAGSLAARLLGNHRLGRGLGYAGLAFVGVGGYVGSHLAYRQSSAVNQAAPLLRQIPDGWHDLCDEMSLTPGQPSVARIGEVPVLVARADGEVVVMLEHCGHETGPLSEGAFVRDGDVECVVCPWHGSTFRLADGAPLSGPAASSQPVLRSRVVDGRVQASLP